MNFYELFLLVTVHSIKLNLRTRNHAQSSLIIKLQGHSMIIRVTI